MVVFSSEAIRKIRQKIMPFSSFDVYIGKEDQIKSNYQKTDSRDKLLLATFIINSVLIIATAIYAPNVTNSVFFSLWQFGQFGLVCYLGYRSSKRKKARQQ